MRSLEEVLQGESHQAVSFKAAMDFKFFSTRVWGMDFSETGFHDKTCRDLVDSSNAQLALILPRGHSKTETCSVAYPAWRMYREKGYEFMLTSGALDQSIDVLGRTQDGIESNEFLSFLVPSDRRVSWSKKELNTSTGNKYVVKPFNSSMRGGHYDEAVCDDILREADLTPEQVKEIFWSVFYPTLQSKGGRPIVVGTPMFFDDIFADLKELESWQSRSVAACELGVSGELCEPVLWPERFPLKKLKEIQKQMGPIRFSREYLCNPVSGGSAVFSLELIKRQTMSLIRNAPVPGCTYFLGVDVAISGSKKADFSAFSVLEKDGEDVYRCLQMHTLKGVHPDKQIELIKDLDRKWGFRKIVIEKAPISEGLVKTALTDSQIRFRVEAFNTTQSSKEGLVSLLLNGFTLGELFVCNNLKLIQELGNFVVKDDIRTGKVTYQGVGSHDDTVIALGLSFHGAMSQVGKPSFAVV